MALTGGPLHAKLAHQDDEQQVYTRKAGKPNAMLGVAAVAELVLSRQPSATHERREEPSTPPTHHENRSLAGDTPSPPLASSTRGQVLPLPGECVVP